MAGLNTNDILQWQIDMGVDACLHDDAQDLYQLSDKKPVLASDPEPQTIIQNIQPQQKPAGKLVEEQNAKTAAANAKTLKDLEAAMASFDGMAIKATAMNMVFGDGNQNTDVMLIGEAPGADEDRQGKPFVGVSGQLLDRMMATIGLTRDQFYITNILNWRPPGNRTPTTAEIAVSLPFLQAHIRLINPKIILFVGGTAAKALLNTTSGIGQLRNQWKSIDIDGLDAPIQTMATYHPAYLLRSPNQKAKVWQDLLRLKKKCAELGIKLGDSC